MEIVKHEIEMLNVKAADCFIIHIIDEKNIEHIILVDAGNYNDGQKIIDHLKLHYNSPKIDLAIITHPDDDHYGGFFYLLEKLKNKAEDAIDIDRFWIHDPGNHIRTDDIKYAWNIKNARREARSVLNYNEINLLSLIDELNIPRKEPFAYVGDDYVFVHKDYQLYVLGPTKEYYKPLALSFRNSLVSKAKTENVDEDSTIVLSEDKVFSKTLDEATDDSSGHNQSSLIFIFMPNSDEKYLFMGDAGYQAYNMIPNSLLNYSKNVKWLKVPHHGSKHNLNNEMINAIKPKVAFISTESIGTYLSQAVVNALKKSGCNVYSTHKGGNMLYNQIKNRENYSTATPL